MTFIFQGNPDRFDIDDYLARYPFVYWSAPRLTKKMCIGDRAVIWRSGKDGGAIAVGHIEEAPKNHGDLEHPEALGDDLWRAGVDDPSEIKVGISISEIRLTVEDGMLPREIIKFDPILSNSHIITTPQGSVFHLNPTESARFELIWSGDVIASLVNQEVSSSEYEGTLKLRSHYSRERSRKIIEDKKKSFLANSGKLYCEICGVGPGDKYANEIDTPFIEVHHKVPLSKTIGVQKTTLQDLILLCANCHRVVHRDSDVEKNLRDLQLHFEK